MGAVSKISAVRFQDEHLQLPWSFEQWGHSRNDFWGIGWGNHSRWWVWVRQKRAMSLKVLQGRENFPAGYFWRSCIGIAKSEGCWISIMIPFVLLFKSWLMYAMLYHIATPSWVWGPPPKDLMPHFFVRIFPVWEPMSKRNGWLFLLFQYSGVWKLHPWNLRYPLKVNAWKMKCPLETVPFLWTC